MAIALARKYRPKNFDDLVGQESVSQTLSQALNQDRLSHAYLFSGLRGSGKTSTARIFAKAMLCEKGVSAKPCEVCQHCKSANAGKHIDIVEMDAASNRKIDDIRELIEHTKYKPSMGRYKVFIIDEVHMLTKEAFNAILKTLEEPPEFVKFILATTDPLKIPATILSRSQHFRFKKIAHHLVVSRLEHILNAEGVEYEKEAVAIIARSGAGSLRDSLTLLDQAIVYGNSFVSKEVVTRMLGIIDPSHIDNLVDSIIAKNRDAVIDFVRNFNQYECAMILDEIAIYLKDRLLANDKILTPMIIERFFRVIAQGKELLHIGSDEEFVLSLSLLKMIEAMSIKDIDSMIEELEEVAQKQNRSEFKTNDTAQKIDHAPKAEKPQAEENKKSKFEELIDAIYDKDYDLGKCFEDNIKFVSFDGEILQWSSSATGECKEELGKYYPDIKMMVAQIFGKNVKITLASKPNSNNNATSSCIEKNSSFSDTQASQEIDPKKIVNEPMVQKAAELFKPRKIKIQSKI